VSSVAAPAPAPAALRAGRFRRPRTLTVYRWELRKLISQKRTYLGLAIAMLFPLIFVVSEHFRNGHPDQGNIFASYIKESGLATPVLMLFWQSAFLYPLIAALVAGDVVAAEDGNGTLKTILTRSVDRGQVFAAKLLAAATYALIAVYLSAATATIAGVASWGFKHVITFSGTIVSAPKGLLLIAVAYGVYMIPLLAVVCIGVLLSTVTRNSAAAVVGTLAVALLMSLIALIPGLGGLQPYLLPTEFNNWHGLLRTPTDWAPVWHSLWVCALYAVPAAFAAYLVFLRRDVAGG
jgi:ABC-2 type transport system permease protein